MEKLVFFINAKESCFYPFITCGVLFVWLHLGPCVGRARGRPRWPDSSPFCGNVLMGRGSWQLCFLSARILCDISNKCHGGAMSTAAQQTHKGILVRFLLPRSFNPPQFILIPAPLSPLPLSLLSFICVTLNINLLLPHKCICPHFWSHSQMP